MTVFSDDDLKNLKEDITWSASGDFRVNYLPTLLARLDAAEAALNAEHAEYCSNRGCDCDLAGNLYEIWRNVAGKE